MDFNKSPGETDEDYEKRMIAVGDRVCLGIIKWTVYIIIAMCAIALLAKWTQRF